MNREDIEKLEHELTQLKSLGVSSDTIAKLEANLSQLKKYEKCANQDANSNIGKGGCIIGGIIFCALCWFIKSVVIPGLVSMQVQNTSSAKSDGQSVESILLAQDIDKISITNISEWITITQENRVEFKIPPTMELRSENLAHLAIEYAKANKLPQAAKQIVIQQKGLNSAEKSARNHYVRIIYTCEVGSSGDFCPKMEKLKGFSWEAKYLRKLRKLGNDLKTETLSSFKQSSVPSKILKWNDAILVRFGDYIAIKTSYLRQYDKNEPVFVEVYHICDDSRLHTFLFSCRESESSTWLHEWTRVKNTIRFVE